VPTAGQLLSIELLVSKHKHITAAGKIRQFGVWRIRAVRAVGGCGAAGASFPQWSIPYGNVADANVRGLLKILNLKQRGFKKVLTEGRKINPRKRDPSNIKRADKPKRRKGI
jgi:hypothetical protein